MSEEQETTTQAVQEAEPGVGDSGDSGEKGDVVERGGADGKAKSLGSHGIGDYGRPSRRDATE